jgi:beta-xylosidase
MNRHSTLNEADIFIDSDNEKEKLKQKTEDRQKRIQEILIKHNVVGEDEPTEVNPHTNIDNNRYEVSSSSSNEDVLKDVKKMDEENEKLLKLLEKERNELKRSASKTTVKEEDKNDNSDSDSFDMFDVNSDGEDVPNKIQGKFNDKDLVLFKS